MGAHLGKPKYPATSLFPFVRSWRLNPQVDVGNNVPYPLVNYDPD